MNAIHAHRETPEPYTAWTTNAVHAGAPGLFARLPHVLLCVHIMFIPDSSGRMLCPLRFAADHCMKP